MRYRALTSTGDFSFGLGVQEYLVNTPATVAQAVLTALLLHRGEWFLDINAGMPWETQVLGFNTASIYDTAIKTAMLGVQGVLSILSYSSSLDSRRNLTVNAIIETIYGKAEINTAIATALRGYGVGPFAEIPFGGGG